MNRDPAIREMIRSLPFTFDWVRFKGEDCVAAFNRDASKKENRPMFDISYCATKALNGIVLFTTEWNETDFKPSPLAINSDW